MGGPGPPWSDCSLLASVLESDQQPRGAGPGRVKAERVKLRPSPGERWEGLGEGRGAPRGAGNVRRCFRGRKDGTGQEGLGRARSQG